MNQKEMLYHLGNIRYRCNEEERDGDVEALDAAMEIVESLPQPVLNAGGKPAVDFSAKEWFAKISEEVFEAHTDIVLFSMYVQMGDREAAGDYLEYLALELTDVITVCTSYLEALGYNKKSRARLQRDVNEKNRRRGYLDKPKGANATIEI